MAQSLFWYEGPATDGKRVSGLTYEQAAELQKQEDEMLKNQQSEAQLGPQVAAGIREYDRAKNDVRNFSQQQGGNVPPSSPSPQPVPSQGGVSIAQMGGNDAQPMPISQPAPTQSPFEGTPSFDAAAADSAAGGNGSSLASMGPQQSMPWGGSDNGRQWAPERQNVVEQGQNSKQRIMGASVVALMKDVPPDVIEDMNAQFRAGILTAPQYFKELTTINKTLRDERTAREKEEFKNKLEMEKDTNKEIFATQRNIDDIESREKISAQTAENNLRVAGLYANKGGSTNGGGSGDRLKDLLKARSDFLASLKETGLSSTYITNTLADFDSLIDQERQRSGYKKPQAAIPAPVVQHIKKLESFVDAESGKKKKDQDPRLQEAIRALQAIRDEYGIEY